MFRTKKVWALALALTAMVSFTACQSTDDDTDTLDVDDFCDAAIAPSPAAASACTDGKTYRVVRGNNQPDDILPYDWCTTFAATVSLNKNAEDDDVDLEFPVEIASATVKIQQAAGGIVSTPTGGDTEHYESVILSTTSNKLAAVGSASTISFWVWYDLPSLKSEALGTVTVTMVDDDGVSFSKNETVQIR
jgi:hypothetical protein